MEICVLRPPSPFILSPPSSLRFDAIAPKPKAKADRRGNGCWPVLVLRMTVRQNQSHECSRRRRTILPLLGGEGRGEVEREPFEIRIPHGQRADGAHPQGGTDLSRRSAAKTEGNSFPEIILGWTTGANSVCVFHAYPVGWQKLKRLTI